MLKLLSKFILKQNSPDSNNIGYKATSSELQSEKWHQPLTAEKLLETPLRKKLISLIWQRVSMDRKRFDQLYMAAINNYVEIVQLLPASESHHHSYLGGMIDHGLEVVNYALKLRQPYLLPIGANPEDIPRQSEAWSAAVMYGALLHDVGKVVVDISVEMNNGKKWYPWSNRINLPYRFNYNPKRDYHLHPSSVAIMINKVVPEYGLTWLSQFPDLFPLFLNFCSGHNEKAGVLAEIIQKADMSSVSNNLGGDPTKALAKPVQSLMTKMIVSIRYLLETELKLNGSQACDGWFDGNDVWVVSKMFTDKMKANLLQNGISEAPTDNAKIFNILNEHGIAIANPEGKTIWSCKVESDSGWSADKLTLIRIPVNVAYSHMSKAPEPFKGKITPLESDVVVKDTKEDTALSNYNSTITEQSQELKSDPPKIIQSNEPGLKESEDLNDAVFALFGGDEIVQNNNTDTLQDNSINFTQKNNNKLDNNIINHDEPTILQTESIDEKSDISDDVYEHPFFKWLRDQIISRKLSVNTQTACIHTVENKIFLVTPKIFHKYSLHIHGNADKENWRKIQLEFQAFKIHSKFSDENFNIWKCFISGKRKNNAIIKGYLIDNRNLFAIDDNLPNNPHLSLITNLDIYKQQ